MQRWFGSLQLSSVYANLQSSHGPTRNSLSKEARLKLSDMLPALRAWIDEFDERGEEIDHQNAHMRELAAVISLLVTGVVSSVIATWIAQEMLNNSFPAALVIGLMIVLVLAAFLQVRGLPFRPRPLKVLVLLLTLVIVEATVIAYLFISTQPLTTYIVFDATEATIPFYPELVTNIRLASQVQPDRSLGGLRIYGGRVSGEPDCRDTTQLIAPTLAKDFDEKLDGAFATFDPKGNASLTIAVLSALKDDLKDIRGPVKLVVITSGVDTKCEPELGGIFEEFASDIRVNARSEITIAIIGVGQLSPVEENTLKGYAKAFNGTYLNASKPAELNSVILAAPSYFSDHDTNDGSIDQP